MLEYLLPDASSLFYWGSDSQEYTTEGEKRGRTRTLTPQDEFFLVLTRLRCGFPIGDLGVRFNGVTLNIPPFLDGKPQLTIEKEIETRRIASVRVHVERAIERIKYYIILQQTSQLSIAADLNKIWIICCYLVNFLSPFIAQDLPE